FCVRAQRLFEERQLELGVDAQARISSDLEQQLQANASTIAALITDTLPAINRERWAFQRNERWFEDTLPHLGEFHFRQAFCVSPATFRFLVKSCRCLLERETTIMREPISIETRVAVGLYRLCSSAEDRTIAHLFGIGRSTVNVMYKDFCNAIIEKLEGDWLRMVCADDMSAHMREFFAVFGFPQAVGALDGCHFPISLPKEHATVYYNYKGWHSIILLALVDHRYRFRYINLGTPGRCHDANVYGCSQLHTLVDSFQFQSPTVAIEGTAIAPIILCDQAFPLTTNLLKPFASATSETCETVFNYNLSKTRRIVENAFGRLKARFRFIMKRMECQLPNAKRAIRAACMLHDICEEFRDKVEQQWEHEARELDALYAQPSHNTDVCNGRGQEVRNALADYFWKHEQHTSG
ncbi:unnamed protein product, partial [Ixodes persulcatus]